MKVCIRPVKDHRGKISRDAKNNVNIPRITINLLLRFRLTKILIDTVNKHQGLLDWYKYSKELSTCCNICMEIVKKKHRLEDLNRELRKCYKVYLARNSRSFQNPVKNDGPGGGGSLDEKEKKNV